MSSIADTATAELSDDRLARRNAVVLAVAQALAGGNTTVLFATVTILGSMLAPDKSLATLPVSVYVVGMWCGTLPVGALTRRYGRRTAYQTGTACGVLTGLICSFAAVKGSFPLLCTGALFSGLYAAAHQAYRFGAADTASEAFRAKAISWVMVGGIFAGIIGPQLVIWTKDLLPPYLFAASFLGQSVLAALSALVLMQYRNAPNMHAASATARQGRPLSEILRQPRLLVAVVCGVASFAVMNFTMTAAPLAMVMCQHSVSDATLGIQWHVISMYAPSFFTGALIARFGVERVIGAGLALIFASGVVGLSGLTVAHFWIALVLLGVGWNFGFIGATAMVTQCHRPEERARVQSLNDFLVFGSMIVASFSSGSLLSHFGWDVVNLSMMPVIALAGGLLLILTIRQPIRAA